MIQIFLKIAIFLFRPFSNLRKNVIKALLLAESPSDPEKSIRWLLYINDFLEDEINKQCVAMGNGFHIKHEIMDGIHSFFHKRIEPGSKVLDVGCGNCAVANAISVHAGAQVTGIDMNEKSIQFGSGYFANPSLKLIVGDAIKDLPNETFDVIVMSSFLEHITDRPGLLRKLSRLYKPSKFLIRVPMFERHYYASLKKRLGLFPYTDPDHKTEYTMESFAGEMAAGGLEIVYSEIRWGDIWAECVPMADK